MTSEIYTDQQATEEALLLLIRKLRRLYPQAHADLMTKLPEGAEIALRMGEMRADTLRAYDSRDGITRTYPEVFEDEEIKAA
jgi:hypothetical protein